jgi:hypothetical protein
MQTKPHSSGELSRPAKKVCDPGTRRLGLPIVPPDRSTSRFFTAPHFNRHRYRIERAAVSEEEVIGFIREHVGSVYTLELLLLVKRDRDRCWTVGELVRELRSSATAVTEALSRMAHAGLVSQRADSRYAFCPASPRHEQLAVEIEKAYNSTPVSVVKAIIASPEEKLRAFSDAFKLKE